MNKIINETAQPVMYKSRDLEHKRRAALEYLGEKWVFHSVNACEKKKLSYETYEKEAKRITDLSKPKLFSGISKQTWLDRLSDGLRYRGVFGILKVCL